MKPKEATKGASVDTPKEQLTFLPRIKYNANTYNSYHLHEDTEVERFLSNNVSKKYTRSVDYFVTVRIYDKPIDGFSTINISVDSTKYKFVDGRAVFEFSTEGDMKKAIRFDDLTYHTAINGRTYNIVHSPYGEVAKIDGAEIEDLRNYILVDGAGKLDTLTEFIWLDAISKEKLGYIGDMQKMTFPSDRMPLDSVWKSPLSITLNNVDFIDTSASAKIISYSAGTTIVQAKCDHLTNLPKKSLFYEIKLPVSVIDSKGSGTQTVEISPTGALNSSKSYFDSEIKVMVGKDIMTEKINTKIEWILTGTFKM